MNTNSLLNESAGFNKKMNEEAKGLVSKWEKTGLLEGITTDFERAGIATLLENQAKQLVSEASATGTSANSEEWAGVALPLVRRIFSEIAAKEFVSVQPMNLPSGLVFYLDFKYGTAQPGFETGAGRTSQADSVFGITETANQASEGLYGAGRFGYSINDTQSVVPVASFSSASLTSMDSINYDSAFSASVWAGSNLYTVAIPVASLTGYDAEGVRAFTVNALNEIYPAYTRISGNNVVFVVSGSATRALAGAATVKFQKQPTDITRGDFEQTSAGFGANPETDLGIPELNVELRSVPIVA